MCEDYCSQYKKKKDMELAKLIFKENRRQFRTIEQVRDFVRVIRGHHGKRNRNEASDKTQYTATTYDTNPPKRYKEEVNTSAKVLILDIETAPIKAYMWGIWNQNIGLNQIVHDWFCLTWAAKWLFEDKVYSARLTPAEAKKQDDKRIIKGIWEMVNKADIVIAHNAEKFDMPKLNSRFILNGLEPPLPYQTIDTLKHIRRQFGFTSNKLDYVNKLLNLPRKKENEGMPMWIKCLEGNNDALQEMVDYNVEDVRILEETYLTIRAWIKPHPNMGLFIMDEVQSRCPSCGSMELKTVGKNYVTPANVYEMFRCDNCGSTGRQRVAVKNIKAKTYLLQSIPK